MSELLQPCPFKLLPTLFSQGMVAMEMKIELSSQSDNLTISTDALRVPFQS